MERIGPLAVFSMFINGAALAFIILYFFTYELPALAVAVALALVNQFMQHFRIDVLEKD